MTGTMDMVRMLVSAQTVVTAFLAVLLWSLHARLRRQEFNRWWASAWTLSAVHLSVGRLAMAFPPGGTVAKDMVILVATLVGFLVAPALVFGALSLRSPGTITRRLALSGLGAALLLAATSFGISILWSPPALTAFSVRNAPRTLTLALALFFCARVFFQRVRTTWSWSALVTGVSCLLYGINQSVYTSAEIGQLLGPAIGAPTSTRLTLLTSATLLYVDVALTCGICLGMVLVLVEEYQRAERELLESVSRRREAAEENTALQSEMRRRQEVELTLRASEDRYRDLVEHSEDLVCTHDLEGHILSCNPAPARILGYEVHEMLTMSVLGFIPPEFRNDFDEYIRTIQRDGVAAGLVTVVTRTGERRLWAFRNTLRTDRAATPVVRGMGRDVTEQHHAERALRLSEEQFAVAFRSSPCAMAIISAADQRFIDVNANFEARTGYARAELLNHTSRELGLWIDPTDRDAVYAAVSEHGRLTDREIRIRHKDGCVGTSIISAEVVQVAGERCILVAALDVTARKAAEARTHELQSELAHAGRVLTLGTLTGSLAHEIKQPLAAIHTNAYAAMKLLDADTLDVDEVRAALRDIMTSDRRIDDVIRRLRGLLRKERRDYAPVDVNAIVDDVLMLTRANLIERRISIDVERGSNLPAVLGDRVQLQQVVLNILMNAADAVSAGSSADDRRVTMSTSASGAQVTVSVADRGVGVSTGEFAQMFDPFFTTKDDGMGLGLSICRAIMDAHGGQISATRNPDRGLTCSFVLDAMVPATSPAAVQIGHTVQADRVDA